MPTIFLHRIKHRELTAQESAAIARLSRSISNEPVEGDFEGDTITSLSYTHIPRCPTLERTLQEYRLIDKENDHA